MFTRISLFDSDNNSSIHIFDKVSYWYFVVNTLEFITDQKEMLTGRSSICIMEVETFFLFSSLST